MPRMSQADYLAYLARAKQSTQGPEDAVEVESELHRDIAAECARRKWLAFHGSMAHQTFRTEGEPDFVICADRGRLFMVECKSRTGKLSPAQAAIAAWADTLGHKVHVIRSVGDFIALVDGEVVAEQTHRDNIELRIKGAMELSLECLKQYLEKGYDRHSGFAAGQIDAFKAVLRWLNDSV